MTRQINQEFSQNRLSLLATSAKRLSAQLSESSDQSDLILAAIIESLYGTLCVLNASHAPKNDILKLSVNDEIDLITLMLNLHQGLLRYTLRHKKVSKEFDKFLAELTILYPLAVYLYEAKEAEQ